MVGIAKPLVNKLLLPGERKKEQKHSPFITLQDSLMTLRHLSLTLPQTALKQQQVFVDLLVR